MKNKGEPSTRQKEVMVDEHVNNTWDPQQFLDLQRNDLNEDFEKIKSRHESFAVTPTIFRVPTQLNHSYVSACKPIYISIGPYNRGEPKRRFMEAYKLHYLYELWRRINSGLQITDFIHLLRTEMKKIESRARSCYSDSINMKSDEFVEMMLLDGCFIVEFMFKLQPGEMTFPIISTRWGWVSVHRDLHILENQLPFFVLESIYRMVDNSDRSRVDLIDKLLQLFRRTPFQMPPQFVLQQTPDHLLHLFHLSLIGHDETQLPQSRRNYMFYRKATELELSGVKFKRKDDRRLLHVRFHNGILEMSPLTLNEDSNIYLRNFVALEQCQEKYGLHFTSYMFFIDNLVDSNKDVELLIKRGIFYNDMGSNDVVVKHFFDRLSNEIATDSTGNHLYDTLQEMQKYCEKPWAKWKAMLFRDYFNNPWSILSFFAAFLLLALTMLQETQDLNLGPNGCFIVEFMFKLQPGEMTFPIISTRWGWIYVLRDLHLLENQLPFFVLESIYRMVIDNSDRPRDALTRKLHYLLFKLIPFEMLTRLIPQQTPDHLLHLFHLSCIGHDDHPNMQIPQDVSNDVFYRKATELELSGVKFKTKDDGRLLHVSFHNGILEMSPLTLNEDSNIYLRNFVALEQCQEKYGLHFTSYIFFIDNLVDSNKDVELLIKRGIFYNDMGSNEVVVKHFFDRLSNEIATDSTRNHLYDTLQEMQKYCEKPWAKWKAMLFRDYFNNPWSILSFVAAVLLLALTMLQASGTIYRYIKN